MDREGSMFEDPLGTDHKGYYIEDAKYQKCQHRL